MGAVFDATKYSISLKLLPIDLVLMKQFFQSFVSQIRQLYPTLPITEHVLNVVLIDPVIKNIFRDKRPQIFGKSAMFD
jgi:hypothetical protein